MYKTVHGDLFAQPTVKGSEVKKVRYKTLSNGNSNKCA